MQNKLKTTRRKRLLSRTGKNHHETSRKGAVVKRAGPVHTGSGLRRPSCWELSLERREARITNQAPKHRAPVLGSDDHIASRGERPQDFSLLGREVTHWKQSYYYYFVFANTHLGPL